MPRKTKYDNERIISEYQKMAIAGLTQAEIAQRLSETIGMETSRETLSRILRKNGIKMPRVVRRETKYNHDLIIKSYNEMDKTGLNLLQQTEIISGIIGMDIPSSTLRVILESNGIKMVSNYKRSARYDYDAIIAEYANVRKDQSYTNQYKDVIANLGLDANPYTINRIIEGAGIKVKKEYKMTKNRPKGAGAGSQSLSASNRRSMIIAEFNKTPDNLRMDERAEIVNERLELGWKEGICGKNFESVCRAHKVKIPPWVRDPNKHENPTKIKRMWRDDDYKDLRREHIEQNIEDNKVPERLNTNDYQFSVDLDSKKILNEMAEKLGVTPQLLGGSFIISCVRAAENGLLFLKRDLEDGTVLQVQNENNILNEFDQ